VQAGDDLSGPAVPVDRRKERGRFISRVFGELGVDLALAGCRERELDPAVVPARSKVVRRAGLAIGLFGLDLDQAPDAAGSLRAAAAGLRKQGARLVITALHGGQPRARELLKPGGLGIDVAVVSHTAIPSSSPERAGDTWMVETGAQAKQIGVLDLHVLKGEASLAFEDIGLRGQLAAAIADQQQELEDITARAAGGAPALARFFADRRKQIETRLALDQRQLAALPPPDPTRSWVENRQIPLGTEIPDDPVIAQEVSAYKGLHESRPAAGGAMLAGYAGLDACATCHASAAAFWRRTKHAQAWQTLVRKERQNDVGCVTCHVTGNAALPGVQCEACHGPAAAHSKQPGVHGLLVRDPPEARCRTCHNAEQTKEWEFASFRAAIVGPGHGGAGSARAAGGGLQPSSSRR
jgi:hypothetical protein